MSTTHTLETGNLTAAVHLWAVVSRKVATASARVKSETIILFSSILCRRLYWLSMAQYLKQSTWIFNLYSVWQNGVEVYTYMFGCLFYPSLPLICHLITQNLTDGLSLLETIYLSEGLSSN